MVVVITGATSGIGRATALKCAEEGAAVVLAARNIEELQAVALECENLGGFALAVPTDVSKEEEIEVLAESAIATFGKIDVWVNNAAVTSLGTFEDTPTEVMRQIVETNLLGYMYGAQVAIPLFKEQGQGTLINVSSIVGKTGQAFASVYSATKAGIIGLSDSLRQELINEKDIQVCTVLPSVIDTPLFQHAANFSGKAIKPMNPIYPAEDVADAILALIQKPKRESYVGGTGKYIAIEHALMPNKNEYKLLKMVEKDHFEDTPTDESTGNIFQPMSEIVGVSGGWLETPKKNINGKKLDILASIGAGITGIAVGIFLVSKMMPARK